MPGRKENTERTEMTEFLWGFPSFPFVPYSLIPFILPIPRLGSELPYLRFDLRQTEQNDVADDLQAARADLIERVLLRVPVIVLSGRAAVLEVNDVDGGNARSEKGHVVVIANGKRAVRKFLLV